MTSSALTTTSPSGDCILGIVPRPVRRGLSCCCIMRRVSDADGDRENEPDRGVAAPVVLAWLAGRPGGLTGPLRAFVAGPLRVVDLPLRSCSGGVDVALVVVTGAGPIGIVFARSGEGLCAPKVRSLLEYASLAIIARADATSHSRAHAG